MNDLHDLRLDFGWRHGRKQDANELCLRNENTVLTFKFSYNMYAANSS
jgi:hypothetical protein